MAEAFSFALPPPPVFERHPGEREMALSLGKGTYGYEIVW
jgi:hypothetical protein